MKKHTKQIVSGVVLFVLGGIVIPTIFCVVVFAYLFTNKPLAKFTIPGQAIVTIEKPGRYYLWNDYQTVLEGQTYSSSEKLPDGLQVSLIGNEVGNAIEFVSDQSITSSSGDSHKNSIGYFEIDDLGIYILSVSGGTGLRVCSLGKSIFTLKNVFIFLGTFVLAMLMGIGGFVFVLIGIMNLIKAQKHGKLDAGSSPA